MNSVGEALNACRKKPKANYAFNATPEQALRSNRAILPARVNAALGVLIMHLDDIVHRVLPAIGPLVFIVAVARLHRSRHSSTLLVCGLSFAVTLFATLVSAWLGLRFDESHDLPDWYGQVYWWLTQWVTPIGYAVAGLSFLAFSMREKLPRGGPNW
jgi:hypothetical protein